MQQIEMYQVDAFTDKVFHGNPAAVCLFQEWLNDELLQAIAGENNLSETAFIVPKGEAFEIRWFTPNGEVSLCGHATLAAAFVMFEQALVLQDEIVFDSLSGVLRATESGGRICLDFPAMRYKPIDLAAIDGCLNVDVEALYEGELDYLAQVRSVDALLQAEVNLEAIAALPTRGLIVTAPSSEADFHSRCFYPKHHVPEDPVTGSAHSMLAPYWAERLGKPILHGRQGLSRRGDVYCEHKDNRVILSGSCRWYMKGQLLI